MKRLSVAVLISGRGSNLAALIDACKAPDFPAEIVCVFSNREDATGLDIARTANITTAVIPHRQFSTRADFDDAVHKELLSHGAELICLAGFMRLFTAEFVDRWYNRILNIHPALLPSFKGLAAQQQALDAGVRIAGCTVHYVSHDTDSGPIIAQAAIPVLSDDCTNSLSARILEAEHHIYPLALQLVAEGWAPVKDEHVTLEEPVDVTPILYNPPLR